MGSSKAALLLFLPALLFDVSTVLGQDLKETDALCKGDGCFVVYFQRKTFLSAWKACKEKGGNLATIRRDEDAATVVNLFSTLDLRYSRTEVRVWIGLQRQPRQCNTTHLLRGFTWTTGDQDTEYVNWQKEDSQNKCLVPRCVFMSYNTHLWNSNFKWLDGSCSEPVDGYLCHYSYTEMCPALWSEGADNVLYTTPFNLQSTILTHVPFGSVATASCSAGAKKNQSVMCMLKEDGSVGWSRDLPLCSFLTITNNQCDQNNGGCEHLCKTDGASLYCECNEGFHLKDDRRSCEVHDFCQEAPCEHECLPLSNGYHCACSKGYMLGPDEHSCQDVDECLQAPCDQICKNAPGIFECQCVEGYHADEDGLCRDVNECINNPCEHNCKNTPGSYVCYCTPGFSPVPEDLTKCQDTDECQILGACQQMCSNYEGGFECYCREGYKLMSDNYSCHERSEEDDQYASVPDVPLVTTAVSLISIPTIAAAVQNSLSELTTHSKRDTTSHVVVNHLEMQKNDYVEVTSTQYSASTQLTFSLSFLSTAVEGSKKGTDREQNQATTWIMVGFLVPIFIVIVVMVLLGIVYCKRCTVLNSNSSTNCYHWIHGAHDKQGSANPSAEVKAHV